MRRDKRELDSGGNNSGAKGEFVVVRTRERVREKERQGAGRNRQNRII